MLRHFIFAKLNGATDAGSKVYPNQLPQSVPTTDMAITYHEIGSGSMQSAAGAQGVCMARVQINAFAHTYDDADDLLEQVRIELDGFSGTSGGVTVQHCLMVPNSKRDMPFVDPGNEELNRFGKFADFNVFFVEPFPNP